MKWVNLTDERTWGTKFKHCIPQQCVKQVKRQNYQKQTATLHHGWIFSAKMYNL